jgi:hypothetical protein
LPKTVALASDTNTTPAITTIANAMISTLYAGSLRQ